MDKLRVMLSSKNVAPRRRAPQPTAEAHDRTRSPTRAEAQAPPRKRAKQTAQRPPAGRTSHPRPAENPTDVRPPSPVLAASGEADASRATGSSVPPVPLYSDIINATLKVSLGEALRLPRPDNILDVLGDLHSSMCRNVAAGSAVMADLATQWKVDPELLMRTLEKQQLSSATLVESRLRGEISQLKQDLVNARADISERDIAIEGLKDDKNRVVEEAKYEQSRYEAKIATLVARLGVAEERLRAEKAEKQACSAELKEKAAEIDEMTEVMGQQIERLKLLGFRQCMLDMMKKIREKYPEADLGYFADAENVPEVEIDPAIFGGMFDGLDSPTQGSPVENVDGDEQHSSAQWSEQLADATITHAGDQTADQVVDDAPGRSAADAVNQPVAAGEATDAAIEEIDIVNCG